MGYSYIRLEACKDGKRCYSFVIDSYVSAYLAKGKSVMHSSHGLWCCCYVGRELMKGKIGK